jgi:thiaminase
MTEDAVTYLLFTTMTLTRELEQSDVDGFNKAVKAPFIVFASEGRVPKAVLSRWLSQDKLYAQAYISFVGSLLTHLNFQSQVPFSQSLEWQIFDTLLTMLNGIKLELEFFHATAQRYGLDLSAPWEHGSTFAPNPVTRAYTDLFTSTSLPRCSLLEGMTLLWATEFCYLKAWQNVVSKDLQDDYSHDLDGGALRSTFAPNWTSAEFEQTVGKLGDLVNELAEKAPDKREACRTIWRQVLWLEEQFWPSILELTP